MGENFNPRLHPIIELSVLWHENHSFVWSKKLGLRLHPIIQRGMLCTKHFSRGHKATHICNFSHQFNRKVLPKFLQRFNSTIALLFIINFVIP